MNVTRFQSPNPRSAESGGALIISLLVVLVIGVSLGSYLRLVSSQNASVNRSLAWNSAVPAMEAGVEEALTHLYHRGITDFSANGWAQKSDGWYQKSVSLGADHAYVVRVQPVEPPVIVATGVAPSPLGNGTIVPSESSVLSAAADSQNFIRRSVRVDTKREGSPWVKGMVAKGQIDLKGNNIATDSFDSESPLYSTGGKYDAVKRKDKGDVATNSGLVNSLSVGNANIMGNVSTGPGGSVSIGPNGTVGDKAWVTSGKKGVQPGHSSADMNVSFPDITPPFTTGSIPPSGTVDGTAYNYVMGDGDYYVSSLSGKIIVTGDARIYVSTSISLSGQDYLMITNGGSLEMYVAAPSTSLKGKGIFNAGGMAKDFKYYGLPSNTSIDLGGNAAFTGVIYAPNADFSLGGGGNNTYDFVGASITKTVSMNGHFNFHYDESLARLDAQGRGYIPIAWNEMGPTYGLPSAALAGVSIPSY
jgi:hypothetical protein